VYTDKSFDFVIKTPPVNALLMEYTKKTTGSAEPNRKKIGQVSKDIIEKIAQEKMPDLNCFTLEAAMSMVAGSAKSAGFTVEGY
jgi:large subunit ribosomal protein L11